MERLIYTIDGIGLLNFGITVAAVNGILDIPGRKMGYKNSWQEISGEDVDLGIMANEVREIELHCQIKANTPAQAITQFNSFMAIVDGTQAKCLQIGLFDDGTLSGKFLSFLIYREDPIKLEKKFVNGHVIWPFTIKFKEFLPVKRHFKFESGAGGTALTLTISNLVHPIVVVFDGTHYKFNEDGVLNLNPKQGIFPLSIFSNSYSDYNFAINATLLWSMS